MEGTRIAVHDVIGLLQNGQTVERITANRLPMLTKAQVYACLADCGDHPGEVDGWWRDRWRTMSRDLSCSTTTYPRM